MHIALRLPAATACSAFLLLAGCGGGATPDAATATGGGTSGSGGTAPGGSVPGGTGGGAGPGDGVPGGSTGGGVATDTLIFPDALNPTIAELGGMESQTRATMVTFSALNALPSIERPTVGLATFGGAMVARIGEGEEFMTGQVEKTINFRTSMGTGVIEPRRISGNDVTGTDDGILYFFNFSQRYNIIIDRVTATEFSGIVTGSASNSDRFGPQDTYTINDAIIDGRYIDNRTNLDTIGTIRGTITSNAGTRPLDGVLYASPTSWTN